MESSYSILPVENLVRMKMVGRLTAEAVTSLMKRISAESLYCPGMNVVADFRDCVGAWDYSEVQRFRDHIVLACGPKVRRWALLVRPGELEAVGRVFIAISEAAEARVRMQLFHDCASAQRWVRGEPF